MKFLAIRKLLIPFKPILEIKEDLLKILAPYFANVKVFETIYPGRHNLYFYASDGIVPFDEKWQSVTSSARSTRSAPE